MGRLLASAIQNSPSKSYPDSSFTRGQVPEGSLLHARSHAPISRCFHARGLVWRPSGPERCTGSHCGPHSQRPLHVVLDWGAWAAVPCTAGRTPVNVWKHTTVPVGSGPEGTA